MKRTFKRGFTLIELLVVISIIAMLAGLTIPAVNSARESGRRATCINNQKNIALAFQMYEQTHHSYPYFRSYTSERTVDQGITSYNNLSTTVTAEDGTTKYRNIVGWIPQIFPFVEQMQLYDEISNYGYTTNCELTIELFVCKSAGTEETNANNYVANCGVADLQGDATYASSKAYGMMNDGLIPNVRKLSIDDVKDGSSNTLLISENLQAGELWSSNEFLVGFCVNSTMTLASTDPSPSYSTPEMLSSSNGLPMKPNYLRDELLDEPFAEQNTANDLNTQAYYWGAARMSSSHPNVVVAAMVDGSTRVISDGVSAKVLTQAMAPNDKGTVFYKNGTIPRTFDASSLSD